MLKPRSSPEAYCGTATSRRLHMSISKVSRADARRRSCSRATRHS